MSFALAAVLAALAVAMVLVALSTSSARGASAGVEDRAAVRPTQAVAILLRSQPALSAPVRRSAALQVVQARRPLTGVRTMLPVLGRRIGADGVRWLRVLLPGRPNGHTGWIKGGATDAWLTSWHIVVDTSERRVTVYKKGRAVRVFKAIVGKPSTPTPNGKFFVEETIKLRAGEAGAPFALALSAHSNVLLEFGGGPGQVALHGLRNVGGVLGTAVSHGCVRLDNEAMRWLVVRIGPGVPVTIKA